MGILHHLKYMIRYKISKYTKLPDIQDLDKGLQRIGLHLIKLFSKGFTHTGLIIAYSKTVFHQSSWLFIRHCSFNLATVEHPGPSHKDLLYITFYTVHYIRLLVILTHTGRRTESVFDCNTIYCYVEPQTNMQSD